MSEQATATEADTGNNNKLTDTDKYIVAMEEVIRMMTVNPNLVMSSANPTHLSLEDPTSVIGVSDGFFINAMVKNTAGVKITIRSNGFDHLSRLRPIFMELSKVAKTIDGSITEIMSYTVKPWDCEDPIRVERLTGLCSDKMRKWLIDYKDASPIIPAKKQGVCYFTIKLSECHEKGPTIRYEVEDV